jgi:hypothetical protein
MPQRVQRSPKGARQKRSRAPNKPRGRLESGSLENLDSTDRQERRARELEELGDFAAATKIRRCGVFTVGQCWSCKRRECPRCARRKRAIRARRVASSLKGMTPCFLLCLIWGTTPLGALDATLQGLGRARTRIRDWCRRHGIRAVGQIEPKLTNRNDGWNVHLHLAVDRNANLRELRSLWTAIAGPYADLKVRRLRHSEHSVALRRSSTPPRRDGRTRAQSAQEFAERVQRERVGSYVSKEDHECPEPDSMDLKALAELLAALKRKHLSICWPRTRSRRRTSEWSPLVTAPSQEETTRPPGSRGPRRWAARPAASTRCDDGRRSPSRVGRTSARVRLRLRARP